MESILNEIKSIVGFYTEKINQSQNYSNSKEIEELELRIAKLNENKKLEIENYLNRFNTQSDFYIKYGTMVKKDLEQVYKKQEERLKNELEQLKGKNETDKLKSELRKKLTSKRIELRFELQKERIMFNSIMQDLSNFKYEYNNQQQIINGSEWRNLFGSSTSHSDNISEINICLDYIEETLKSLEEKIIVNELKENVETNEELNVESKNQVVMEESLPIKKVETDVALFTLPNGDIISKNEYNETLNKYREKDKDRKFVVMSIDTTFNQHKELEKRVA